MTSELALEEHGLAYPSGFLDSLPVLSPPLPPAAAAASSSVSPGLPTIRALTAAQFADMHTRYLTTHAPDSVIFPFLHGLEGENDAQNAFFYANGSYNPTTGVVCGKDGVDPVDKEQLKARVPRFRGLVWVASDEDEVEEYERALRARKHAAASSARTQAHTTTPSGVRPLPITSHSPSHVHTEDDLDIDVDDDLEEDDYSTSSLDDDEDEEDESDDFAQMPMEVDGPVDLVGSAPPPHHVHGVGVVGMDVDLSGEGVTDMGVRVDLLDHTEGSHMHPSVPRSRPALSAIDTGAKEPIHTQTHHRLSNASSTSSFTSSTSTSTSPPASASTSASPSLPTPPTPPSSLPDTPASPPPSSCSSSASSECASIKASTKSPVLNVPERVTLTSTFKPRELLCIDRETGETRFVEPKVPDGISLRNFGIQVPIFATLSDVVVYSPRGNTKAALAVASHFAHAIEAKRRQRAARGQTDLLHYNVFVLHAKPEDLVRDVPHVVSRMADEIVGSGAHTAGTDALTMSETHSADPHSTQQQQQQQLCVLRKANTISFAQREKDEMRELTQASEIMTVPVADEDERHAFSASTTAQRWDQSKGQVFLGNASDVPLPQSSPVVGGRRGQSSFQSQSDEWDFKSNDPALGMGYDICIECDDMAPFPSQAHMRAAEEHVAKLERRWAERCLKEMEGESEPVVDSAREIPLRPPPSANLVVHLPFPSSVAYAGNSILPFVAWLEGLLKPVDNRLTVGSLKERKEKEAEARRVVAVSPHTGGPGSRPPMRRSTNAATIGHSGFGGPSSLPPPSAFPTSFLPSSGSSPLAPTASTASAYTRMRSTSATHLSSPSSPAPTTPLPPLRTRPLKILIYSADGYTESSSLALSLLMSLRSLTLPEAYLELQVEKRRSFFVYANEITPMKRIEARLERERMAMHQPSAVTSRHGRPPAMSVSFAHNSIPAGFMSPTTIPGMLAGHATSASAPLHEIMANSNMMMRRPRACTLPPPLSVISDHQLWFNDPRFDGSFPSRVLPFLYLGNLNHAANAYMLHALGITHVVSVGECALIPPENGHPARNGEFTTAKPGSLWIEEREGRIKVLDIKGVCDDGIDSLEPQLPPICEWIDEARQSGGKVLVHCRVGVSRSATVTIAYVMKHLGIPLVDAYLIVRSRRLSVLIQPNMRLLYNLLGWEVKLAQERAGNDPARLGPELARCLNWPYLAKEVHALNEKYLH